MNRKKVIYIAVILALICLAALLLWQSHDAEPDVGAAQFVLAPQKSRPRISGGPLFARLII